jgi:hypothetical protein
MAISRPILLALVAALLALVAFYATMGARTSGDESGEPAKAVPEPAPAKPDGVQAGAADAAKPAKRPAGSARTSNPAAERDAGAASRPRLPAEVARAMAGERTVVLFFFQRGSADDEATARAVSALRRRGGAKVFSAPISRLASYGAVTAGAGVSQAPAIVILRKGRGARLVEGFVDPETLIQQVADAR